MFKAESSQQSEPKPQQQPSLKRRALQGSAWTFVGYGTSQVIRLGSNLILTRLLFPEVFGLMALVQTFLVGLEMFSDVGINISIIQNKRGNDPAFLNTAWTVQVIRGLFIWLVACLIAVPVAQFYREPILISLLPVSGATAVISGLNSTKLATANRQINLGRLTLINLGSQVVGIFVMILGAWMLRSVWALVIGGLVSSLTTMVASHLFLEGERNCFYWERDAFRSLYHFGLWIFFATVFGFLSSQGDRLVLGRLLDVHFLGIYNIALTLALISQSIISQLENSVLLPSYSETVREHPKKMHTVLRKTRLMIIGMGWILTLPLIIFGRDLINIMYDSRYTEAGWILQILSIGALVRIIDMSYSGIFIAIGKVSLQTFLIAIDVVLTFAAMLVGYHLGGYRGVIIGIASVPLLSYAFAAISLHRLSLWQPRIDVPLITIASICAICFYVTSVVH